MTDDLADRLAHPAECPACGYTYHDDLCGEAALAIQALRAEVDIKGYRVDAAAEEIERLRAENAAFRNAIRAGDGPSCEDVCIVECVGVCGITIEESPC